MSQNLRSFGVVISAGLLIFTSAVCLVLGIWMMAYFEDKAFITGVIITGCSILLFICSTVIYRTTLKEKEFIEKQQSTLHSVQVQSQLVGINAEILVHWVYSPTEWRQFLLWKRKTATVSYIAYYFKNWFLRKKPAIHEAIITTEAALINEVFFRFGSDGKVLNDVTIVDSGSFYLLQITFTDQKEGLLSQVQIPIPKGALKEAVKVQEKLTNIKV